MTSFPFVSRFTPSLMDAATLEAVFVQREPLAQRLVDTIRESVLTEAKHHSLVIGPRGMGKTHLVSLIYHRIAAIDDLRGRIVMAWLREEEWGVTSFLDLLLRVLRALDESQPDPERVAAAELLFDLAPQAAEREAARLVERAVRGRTLLLIAENLDELFAGLGDEGQQRLRAHVQEHRTWTILATAQSLFNGVSLQTSPFYGFFRIVHLRQLDVDDAIRLLANIASMSGDVALAEYIATPEGRARIRAIHHLAGGNPRVYVILSHFISRTSLDALAQLFLQAMDDLTPYYQARMQWLSPQQRKIVEHLVDRRGAAPVKEIAQRSFITPQTASSQLKGLRDMGYVQSHTVGRESYYELREPLMRFALEMKKQRGEPIRLFVDFLQLWYSRQELREQLEQLTPERRLDREYLERALRDLPRAGDDPRVAACVRDYRRYYNQEDWTHALQAAEEITVLRGDSSDWRRKADCLEKLERWNDAASAIESALAGEPDNAFLWRWRGWCLLDAAQPEEALKSFDRALAIAPTNDDGWYWRSRAFFVLGQHDDALTAASRAVELDPADGSNWSQHSLVLVHMGRLEEALYSIDQALEAEPDDPFHWVRRGLVLFQLARYTEAITGFEHALRLDKQQPALSPETQDILGYWYGCALQAVGRIDEALHAFTRARTATADSTRDGMLTSRIVECLVATDRLAEAVALLESALAQWGGAMPRHEAAVRSIISALLRRGGSGESWSQVIDQLTDAHRRNSAASMLAQALTESISDLMTSTISDAAARQWVDLWTRIAGRDEQERNPDFSLPLRLLAAAAEYRESGNVRSLLHLPVEERTLLEPLLANIPAG